MAALVLTTVATGFAAGAGLSAFATAALTIGAGLVGSYIDQQVFGTTQKFTNEGPRLDEVRFTGSSEGATINRTTGRVRTAGNIIWTTKYREVIKKTKESSGGGKGGGGGNKSEVTTIEYLYYVSCAVAVCEGPILAFGRIWADGAVMQQENYNIEYYLGTEDQQPSGVIAAIEDSDASGVSDYQHTTAYRGIAYVVFEDMLLSEGFGNRIPQLNFEVYNAPEASLDEYERRIKAVTVIPSSGEFAYGTTIVSFSSDYNDSDYDAFIAAGDPETGSTGYIPWQGVFAFGSSDTDDVESANINANGHTGDSDWAETTDLLESLTDGAIENVSLVIAWHGDNLDAAVCTIVPKVETQQTPEIEVKGTKPYLWQAGDLTRYEATSVSYELDGSTPTGPYIGGTVADRAVKEAIEDVNARGLNATFYPFILMDIPPYNTLTQLDEVTVGQSAFPWRGRISVKDSVKGTAQAATDVASFFGTCTASDFGSWDGRTIPYTGPAEWGIRRMVLHYAKLCAAAGGVDTFIIGTEMVELNRVRDNTGAYPAVAEWIDLAAEVRSILGGGTTITYAADWSEWCNHRDGSDVIFHLDPLWADPNIDVIGVDNYLPLADWRDGVDHLDRQNYDSIYDLEYLKSNISGGENYDWYYDVDSDPAARINQDRTAIVDGHAANEPWIYRNKDFRNWWLNQHYNRPGGVRDASPTAWVPQSKPIWFTEVGCPAVDKGANQPNVFIDPKSSESYAPYFSNAARDDFMPRQFNIAHMEYWSEVANNPISSVYLDSMIDTDRMYIWTWDCRPYPEFPFQSGKWSDGDNWETGHWLNGRIGLPSLAAYVEEVCEPFNVTVDTSELYGLITGYYINETMSARSILQPLMTAYSFDAYESEGIIKFKHRGAQPAVVLTEDDLVIDGENAQGGPFSLTRSQLTETPAIMRAKFMLDDYDYTTSAIESTRLVGSGSGVSETSFNLVMYTSQAQSLTDTLLIEAHQIREAVETRLPPSLLRLDASDVITMTLNDREFDFRLEELGFEGDRPTKGFRTDATTYQRVPGPVLRRKAGQTVQSLGSSTAYFMNLPVLEQDDLDYAPWIAATSTPWTASQNVYRAQGGSSFSLDISLTAPAAIGSIVDAQPLAAGPLGIWDRGNLLKVHLNSHGNPSTGDYYDVLAGSNVGALYNESADAWEIIQWRYAEPDPDFSNIWHLTHLLRGQMGSEDAMGDPHPAGTRFIILNSAIEQSTMPESAVGTAGVWSYGPITDSQSADTYTTVEFTPDGVGRKPFSPTSLSAVNGAATNDITLSWIRRTRFGGELWGETEVPLNEDTEDYEIDIYDSAGTSVVRTISVTDATTATYTSAQQTTDHGADLSTVDFEVFQVSAIYGRGTGRRAQIDLQF